MEANFLPSAEVVREIKNFIPVELYTDRGRPDDNRNQALERELVKTVALPVYVIVWPDGKVVDFEDGRLAFLVFGGFLMLVFDMFSLTVGQSASRRYAGRCVG